MTWLLALATLIAAMLALGGIFAERNFSRSLDPLEPRDWHAALPDALRAGHN